MANKSICIIEDCNKPARGRGYCQSHYQRLWRYGDPLAGGPYRLDIDSDICTVEGCTNKRSGRYCSTHASRLWKHGDVNKGARQARSACTVADCGSPHYGHGYCVAHYKRWRKYGDPLKGGTKWGEVRRWLHGVAIPYTGDDCLAFPYARNPQGYGHINVSRRYMGAHVYVLEKTVGVKPSPEYECCHKCGNGHEGCVNPRHLYWGTRSDNMQDAIRHGTHVNCRL